MQAWSFKTQNAHRTPNSAPKRRSDLAGLCSLHSNKLPSDLFFSTHGHFSTPGMFQLNIKSKRGMCSNVLT